MSGLLDIDAMLAGLESESLPPKDSPVFSMDSQVPNIDSTSTFAGFAGFTLETHTHEVAELTVTLGSTSTFAGFAESLPSYFQKVPLQYNHFPLGVVWWLARIADGATARQARRTYELFEHKWKGPDCDEWRTAGQRVLRGVGHSETSNEK